MEKIASFMVNHLTLKRGVYVSRLDKFGETMITTFDIRMTRPNFEPVLNTAEIHTIEHLGATFIRNHEVFKNKAVYFGPMGCRSGFYLILAGMYISEDIVPLMRECFNFVANFEGAIPGASAVECGNYLDMDLPAAKKRAKEYCDVLEHITPDRLVYPK